MREKPPLLPVLIGLGTVAIGLFNGLMFTVYAVGVLLNRPENAPPIATLVPGLLGLMTVFTLLLLPAGVGILLHRAWGKSLAAPMALGVLITGGLGTALGAAGMSGGYSDTVMATFVWGLLTGLVWAVILNIAFRARSMKVAFGEVSQPSPSAAVDAA